MPEKTQLASEVQEAPLFAEQVSGETQSLAELQCVFAGLAPPVHVPTPQ